MLRNSDRILAYGSLVLCVALATLAMAFVRFRIVEPEALAAACVAGETGWRCLLREFAVAGFLHNVYGWTALLTGLFATVARWRWLAFIAIASGVAGAMLYTFELSGVGLLLGALVWIQSAPSAPTANADRGNQQPT